MGFAQVVARLNVWWGSATEHVYVNMLDFVPAAAATFDPILITIDDAVAV